MGFYRHDQRGGCLPCWRGFDNWVFNEGGDLRFRLHFYPSKQYRQSDQHKVQCTSTWLNIYDDVHGTDVLGIPFKRSILHLKCKFKLHLIYRWISNAFECMNVHLKLLSMKWCCNGELMSLMCGWNQLKEVCCKVICKCNSNLNLN